MEGPTTCRATCCYGSATCRATVNRWHLLYVCSRMRYVGGSPCQQATRLFQPYILDNNGDTTSLLMLVACSMSLYRGDTHLKVVSWHAGKANEFVVISYICGGTLGSANYRATVSSWHLLWYWKGYQPVSPINNMVMTFARGSAML